CCSASACRPPPPLRFRPVGGKCTFRAVRERAETFGPVDKRRPRVMSGTRAAQAGTRAVPLPAHPRAQSDADGESRACRVPLETGVTAGMEAARHGCSARDAPVAVEAIQANGVPVPLDERR